MLASGRMTKWIYLGLLILCSGYALRRGGAPERMAAAMVLAAVAATIAVGLLASADFVSTVWGVALVDAALMLGMAWLAIRADRFWPIWMLAILTLGPIAHLGATVAPGMPPDGYAILHAISGYPTQLLLALATWRHQRRLTSQGSDPDWRT